MLVSCCGESFAQATARLLSPPSPGTWCGTTGLDLLLASTWDPIQTPPLEAVTSLSCRLVCSSGWPLGVCLVGKISRLADPRGAFCLQDPSPGRSFWMNLARWIHNLADLLGVSCLPGLSSGRLIGMSLVGQRSSSGRHLGVCPAGRSSHVADPSGLVLSTGFLVCPTTRGVSGRLDLASGHPLCVCRPNFSSDRPSQVRLL